jgi:hypothetical protein
VIAMPARDRVDPPPLVGPVPVPLYAEQLQATLPPGQFTTATYRKALRDRPRRPDQR